MSQAQLDRLQELIETIEGDGELSREEFDAAIEDLETGTKYTVASYNMFCTSEDILVICDMDTEEFIQIEVPMDENEEIIVTRDQ
jgi:hypothetical protein